MSFTQCRAAFSAFLETAGIHSRILGQNILAYARQGPRYLDVDIMLLTESATIFHIVEGKAPSVNLLGNELHGAIWRMLRLQPRRSVPGRDL
eukprot:30318-Pyramimonas_sp.AAC.1